MAHRSRNRPTSSRLIRLAVLTVAMCAGGLALTPFAHAAEQNPRGKLLGVVPRQAPGQSLSQLRAAQRAASFGDLSYHGGLVMRTNRTYALFWQSSAAPPSQQFSATYVGLINRFLADVAADSFKRSNRYSANNQYYDRSGHITYNSTYGGLLGDTQPYPTQTCADPTRPLNPCLTDSQVQAELTRFLNANPSLPRGLGTVYIILTPPGVSSCDNSLGACSFNTFCAYHSNTSDALYTNQPYPDTGGCDPSGQHPSFDGSDATAKDADMQMSLVSHEHSEAITDPLGNAWFEDAPGTSEDGYENADKCQTSFGAPLGSTYPSQPDRQFNQQINGHTYWLQEEWSNLDGGCVQRSANRSPTAAFSSSPNPGSTGQAVSFNGTQSSDVDGDIAAFNWDFGDGTTGAGATPTHSYSNAGSYTVHLTVADGESATGTATALVTVKVSAASKPTITFLTSQRTITATRKGSFSYSLRGTPAGTGGRISFGTLHAITVSRRKRKLSLGSSAFKLPGAGKAKVTIKLSSANLATLKRKRSLSIKATVTIGGVTKTVVFTLKAPKR